jgi:hypothetical protein
VRIENKKQKQEQNQSNAGDMAQVVKHLPSKYKALRFKHQYHKNKS